MQSEPDLVTQELPQASKAVAHGGLGDPDLDGSACHPALGQ